MTARSAAFAAAAVADPCTAAAATPAATAPAAAANSHPVLLRGGLPPSIPTTTATAAAEILVGEHRSRCDVSSSHAYHTYI